MRVPAHFIPGPISMRALDETHAAFSQATRDKALPTEFSGRLSIQPVQFPGSFGLLLDIKCFRRLALHAKSKFKGLNTALQLGIMLPPARAATIELLKHVQFIALLLGR